MESLDTSGLNAESASEKKRITKQPITTNNSQPNQITPRTSIPNTTPNSCAKSVAKWDTPPGTATTEIRRRQPTAASRILSSQQRRTNNSEKTSGRPTTEYTLSMNCPTRPTMKPTMLRKWNDTMTWRTQKTSKATSSKFTNQKCAPSSLPADYYSKTTNN